MKAFNNSDHLKFEKTFTDGKSNDEIDLAYKSRAMQILAALRKHGFDFKTPEEEAFFAKSRCATAENIHTGDVTLFVDKGTDEEKLICSWNNRNSEVFKTH